MLETTDNYILRVTVIYLHVYEEQETDSGYLCYYSIRTLKFENVQLKKSRSPSDLIEIKHKKHS